MFENRTVFHLSSLADKARKNRACNCSDDDILRRESCMQLASNGGTFNNNNPTSSDSTFAKNSHQNALKLAPQAKSSDLLIARKASLHRFLEQRKDRIIARAPYKANGSAGNPVEPEVGFSVGKQPAMPESGKQPIRYRLAFGGSKPVFCYINYFG